MRAENYFCTHLRTNEVALCAVSSTAALGHTTVS